MNAQEIKVGTKVTYSGFAGTVREICEWSRQPTEVMVVVRLKSGDVCVTCLDCIPVALTDR